MHILEGSDRHRDIRQVQGLLQPRENGTSVLMHSADVPSKPTQSEGAVLTAKTLTQKKEASMAPSKLLPL